MNAARDFIEKELLESIKDYIKLESSHYARNALREVEFFIRANRAKWDKPDHIAEVGVVDEEAFEVAAKSLGFDKEVELWCYLEIYEQAKLDKQKNAYIDDREPSLPTGKTDSAKPSQEVHSLSGVGDSQPMPTTTIGQAWKDFKAENDRRLGTLYQVAAQENRTVEELPPLPEKKVENFTISTLQASVNTPNYATQADFNALIDYVAALGRKL